ncbi:hypothetical protein JT358_15965 [Micrococcales bacterium 31B]|nr:hypothetical protein [Micrococcales bacterium 31B]
MKLDDEAHNPGAPREEPRPGRHSMPLASPDARYANPPAGRHSTSSAVRVGHVSSGDGPEFLPDPNMPEIPVERADSIGQAFATLPGRGEAARPPLRTYIFDPQLDGHDTEFPGAGSRDEANPFALPPRVVGTAPGIPVPTEPVPPRNAPPERPAPAAPLKQYAFGAPPALPANLADRPRPRPRQYQFDPAPQPGTLEAGAAQSLPQASQRSQGRRAAAVPHDSSVRAVAGAPTGRRRAS